MEDNIKIFHEETASEILAAILPASDREEWWRLLCLSAVLQI
jgi:hypothetical protein